MHFDQYIHAKLEGRIFKAAGVVVAERSHDQQDAVRAPGPSLEHLVAVEHEVLAQCRQAAGRACGFQEGRCTLKARRIREYRETGGTTRFVGPGKRRRVEVRANEPLGWACLLDLRDQPECAGRLARGERRVKTTRRRLFGDTRLEFGKRRLCFRGCDLVALVGFDLAQDIRHRCRSFFRLRSKR
ncbi:hypothetical protein D9M72_521090 [compost metagenome]